jgi:hypothetical protein
MSAKLRPEMPTQKKALRLMRRNRKDTVSRPRPTDAPSKNAAAIEPAEAGLVE